MSLEFEYTTVRKLGDWAGALPDDTDFIDYWYNLFLSETKALIEDDIENNINAFHWTRWREDFEEFVDGYKPKPGEGYDAFVRNWFASYMQYLVFALRLPGKEIAEHYGKAVFKDVAEDSFRGHCLGIDQFVETFVRERGLPPGADEPILLRM